MSHATTTKRLSPREQDVLRLLLQDMQVHEITQQLGLSKKTVYRNIDDIYWKLEVQGRAALLVYARQHEVLA